MKKNPLKQVERVRIFEQAVQQLRSAILNREYMPGERLPTEQQQVEAAPSIRELDVDKLAYLDMRFHIKINVTSCVDIDHGDYHTPSPHLLRGPCVFPRASESLLLGFPT